MSYIVSIIPKFSFAMTDISAKKVSAIKRVTHKSKGVVTDGGEVTVPYKTRIAAYSGAAAVRNHVHGVTAKVYPA